MTINVCIAGATGWVGRSLVPTICAEKDLNLVGAVSRTHAGKKLGEVLMHTSLLAIRQVSSFVGLKRGLDSVMEL